MAGRPALDRLWMPAAAIADQAAFALANLVLQLALARALTPEDFGVFAAGSTLFLLAALLQQTMVLEPMLVFGGARYRSEARAYHAHLRRRWSLAIGALAFGAGCLAAGGAAIARSSLLSETLLAYAVAMPFLLHFWLLRRLALVEGVPGRAAVAGLVYAVVLVAALAAFMLLSSLAAWKAILLAGAAALVAIGWLRRGLAMPVASSPPPATMLADHLRYGAYATGSEAASWLVVNGPVLLLPLLSGFAAAGQWRVLVLVYMPVLQVTAALTQLQLGRHGRSPVADAEPGAAGLLLAAALAAAYAGLAAVAGPPLLHALLGPAYALDSPTLLLAGAPSLLFALAQLQSARLRIRDRPSEVLGVHLAALGTAGIAALCLMPPSLTGLLWAQAGGWAAGLVAATLLLRRRHP